MAGRLRARAGELCLAAGSLAVTLLAVEMALRAAGYVPNRFVSPAGAYSAREKLLLDCYPTNPGGYFDIDLRDGATRERLRALGVTRLDEVARTAPYAVTLRFNSMNFRDGEFPPRRPGVRRVVVLGDSFTEGVGVKEEDTYPRRLERILRETAPGGWEIFNCGRRAADFPALGKMFDHILPLDPDLVIYAMVLNDADRSPEFRARHPHGWRKPSRSDGGPSTIVQDWILDRRRMLDDPSALPMPRLESRLGALITDRVAAWRVGRTGARWYLELYGPENAEGWRRTQEYIRAMNHKLAERGGSFLLASWPLIVNMEGDDPFAAVAHEVTRFTLSAGIRRHDLRPALAGRATETLWVHPMDHHPNDLAHRLAAESLAPVVRTILGGS